MEDHEAYELLRLLAAYGDEYGNDGDRGLSIGRLAADLVDSLPETAEVRACRESLARWFDH